MNRKHHGIAQFPAGEYMITTDCMWDIPDTPAEWMVGKAQWAQEDTKIHTGRTRWFGRPSGIDLAHTCSELSELLREHDLVIFSASPIPRIGADGRSTMAFSVFIAQGVFTVINTDQMLYHFAKGIQHWLTHGDLGHGAIDITSFLHRDGGSVQESAKAAC